MAENLPQEKFKRCPNCQGFVPELATVCMYCNAAQGRSTTPQKKGGIGRIFLYVVVGLFGCMVLSIIGSQFSDRPGASSGESRATRTPTVSVASVPSTAIPLPTDTPVPTVPTTIPLPTDTPVPPVPTATPLPTPTPEPIQLVGTGQQASADFPLVPGLAIARMTHGGTGHFGVRLLDAQGQLVDLLANNIGPFDGSKAFQIDQPGRFLLDISADGGWSMTITQPAPVDVSSAPVSLSGHGQESTLFFGLIDGLHRFVMQHDGQGHFGVMLLAADGGLVDLLANDIGPFDGSKAVGVGSGVYLLNISADGNWNVSIE